MVHLLYVLLVTVYALASGWLLVYGINAYMMIYWTFSGRKRRAASGAAQDAPDTDWPVVTVQLPMYNEKNVCERVMRAAASLDYPRGRLEIQVLDDSTDGSREIVDRTAREINGKGVEIRVIRRADRSGFKAGALAHGTRLARGRFLAVFDADFVPGSDFLRKTIPLFQLDEKVAFVQTRWGHVNRWENTLTVCQSLGIDGHFRVEQPGRAHAGLFLNFNGTAGIWRRSAIEAAGGWSSRTLTEDLDLSYRVQLAGWKPCFLEEVEVPAELPATMTGVRSQQFRWAKGSIQTAMLVLPDVWQGRYSRLKKVEAFLHLTHYGIHPLMLVLSILALPILALEPVRIPPVFFAVAALPLVAATLGPSTLYAVAAFRDPNRDLSSLRWLPLLVIYGTGIAVSNSVAVYEAITGKASSFVRTPKKGEKPSSGYRLSRSRIWMAEIFMGIYSIASIAVSLENGNHGALPFLILFAAGFLTVGIRSSLSRISDA
jgi:cellulose synthase/poly-beta-1,6-N-acetylglucosamine synthase-like glycosyltransferase